MNMSNGYPVDGTCRHCDGPITLGAVGWLIEHYGWKPDGRWRHCATWDESCRLSSTGAPP